MPTAEAARAAGQLVNRNAGAGSATAWGRGAWPPQAARQGVVGQSWKVQRMGELSTKLSIVVQDEAKS